MSPFSALATPAHRRTAAICVLGVPDALPVLAALVALGGVLVPGTSVAAQEATAPPLRQTSRTPPPPSSAPEEPTPQELAESLRDGRVAVTDVVHPDTAVRYGRATAIVDAPSTLVTRIVTDYARYAEFLPHFKTSRVLSRRGESAIVYLEAEVLNGAATLWTQMRIRPLPARHNADGSLTTVFEATMQRGNVERMHARWEITPIDAGARTLLTLQFLVEPDLPLPASVISEQNASSARRAVDRLRGRATDPRFAMASNR
jgi:ribosome-associated toxin RatA of RatAB toxin-antitoxin module